jgi:hypothetical protein
MLAEVPMDDPEDVLELERKIAQASRIVPHVPDPTIGSRPGLMS